MRAFITGSRAAGRWRQQPFLAFTVLTLPVCAVLILWLDKPLALLLHRHAAGLVPLFAASTAAIDQSYEATMATVLHLPVLWWLLGVGYVLGRWVLRQRRATVLLLVLLTHVSSEVSANILKVITHRLRPDFLPNGTDAGGAFHGLGPQWDSFPSAHTAIYWSLFWPLVLAFPRWRWLLLAVPVFVALGRLVLGMHYLSDVWAAIWLVVAWAALWESARRWADHKLGN